MNRILLTVLACAGMFSFNASAQCGNDNSLVAGSLTPPGVGLSTTVTYASGQYVQMYVYAGASYTVSTCGTSSFDTQLTAYDAATGVFVAYNDDYCGLQSTISFTPSQCGYVNILLDQYSCNNSGLNHPVTATLNTAGSFVDSLVCQGDTSLVSDPMICGLVYVPQAPASNCVYGITSDAPATFPVGTTLVTWTGIASTGMISCVQNITVIDSTPPIITCAADTSVDNTPGVCGAIIVLDAPVATDNCSIATVTNDAPASFPLGVTTVTWTAVDSSGNTSTCTQLVTVTDVEAPVITCAGDTLASDLGMCDFASTGLTAPVATDNCSIATVTNDAPATLPLGITLVNWTYTDVNGNIATCAQNVLVVDEELPVLTCTNDTLANDSSFCSAATAGIEVAIATDNCGIASLTSDAADTLAVGTYTVTWTATDVNGNVGTCVQTVVVEDVEAPLILCPTDMNVPNDPGMCSATAGTLTVPLTSDNCGVDTVYNDAPTVFPVGNTIITWTVVDVNGNTATCTQQVVVNDVENPTITCPADVAALTNNAGCTAIVTWTAPVTADNCGVDTVAASHASGDIFPVGTTTVTYTVTDVHGNTATCSFTVAVTSDLGATLAITHQSSATTPDGAIDLTVTGGTAPYTFDWDNDGMGDNDDTEDLTGLVSGTYNVTVTDANGCTFTTMAEVDDITGLGDLSQQSGINIYPNPNNGIFTLELSRFTGENTVAEVYNALGELVLAQNISSQRTGITLNGVNGVVMVRIRQNNTYIYSGTVVVNR